MMRYVGVLRPMSPRGFQITFPDFPVCIHAVGGHGDVRKIARDMLLCHVKAMIRNGEDIPLPATTPPRARLGQHRGGVAISVSLPLSRPSAAHPGVDLPREPNLQEKIDSLFERHGIASWPSHSEVQAKIDVFFETHGVRSSWRRSSDVAGNRANN